MNKILIVIFIISLSSCFKDTPTISCYDKTIVSFDSSNEKLGWTLEIPEAGSRVIPSNLPEEYKIINLPVNVCITPSDEKFYSLNKYYPKSKITSIKRR